VKTETQSILVVSTALEQPDNVRALPRIGETERGVALLEHSARGGTKKDRAASSARLELRMQTYEVRPRKDKRGFDLISDALPFGRLWYGEPDAIGNAIGYAEHRSRSHRAVIRVYDEAGNVIEMHNHAGDFKEP
jgi:hypothetical protein